MSMFRMPAALTRSCQAGQEVLHYDKPSLKSGRFSQGILYRQSFSYMPVQDPVSPDFEDKWGSKAEYRDYNTAESPFYNLPPTYASSASALRQKAVPASYCSLPAPANVLHFLLHRICAHTEERQEGKCQKQAPTDLLRTALFPEALLLSLIHI